MKSIKITEKMILKASLEYLQIKGYVCKRNNSGKIFLKNPNGSTRAINVGEAGWPDVEGMTKTGQYFGIEFKTPIGKQSPDQVVMQDRIRKSGGIYILARSVQDVMDAGL